MKIGSISKLKKLFSEIIEEKPVLGIITHIKPDGDGLGSALALQEVFSHYKIPADIILEEEIPQNYDFLDGKKRTKVFHNDLAYETLLVLDCHESKRLGVCEPLLEKAKKIVVIDHHQEQDLLNSDHFIDVSYVSVGAIIFRVFKHEIPKMKAVSALFFVESIYVSIINDTENFINANTDIETFRICSELMKYGLVPGKVTQQFLLNKTAIEMKYIGGILATIKTFENNKVVFMHSTLEMLAENDLDPSVNSKILRWVKGLKDAVIIVYFSEIFSNKYKLSLRSNIINVNAIARKFGGGGHIRASGCVMIGKLPEIEELILKEIEKQLQ